MPLLLEIVTIEKMAFSEEVDQVTVPTLEGEITILPGHAPIMSALGTGELLIKKGEQLIPLVIDKGSLVCDGRKVSILTNLAERAHEIDAAKAEEAKRRAEELLKSRREEVDFLKAEASLRRELARLKLSQKYRPAPVTKITPEL